MIRIQIELPDELAAHIKNEAVREHVSVAEMIRRAVARFLEAAPPSGADDRYARALAAAGRFKSGRRDLSVRHDAEFAEASRR
jgi:predicted transcriptional regulator